MLAAMQGLGDLEPVWAWAEAAYPEEACGLGLSSGAGTRWVRLPNRAADPRRAFVFDEAAHLAALSAADRAEQAVTAVFHSHCDAPPAWSARDTAGALVEGQPVHPRALQLVLSVRGGRRAGWAAYRFDEASGTFARVSAEI